MTARDDGLDMDRVSQRTISARGAAPIATAGMRSAFDVAQPPKRERVPAPAFDPAAIQIKKAVPIPERTHGATGGKYQTLLDRMKPGDCVELPQRLAAGLNAYAKKTKVPVVLRKLADDLVGVWRGK